MKVVVAIDSLKGSLTSLEAGAVIKEGILQAGAAQVEVFPLADGGEGTVEALTMGLGGEIRTLKVTGPLGEPVRASYGILREKKTAILEMAQAAGLPLVPVEKRNPMNTTTYGLGELILDAVEEGCLEFLIGIGGSATNDGGLGMLEALGCRFYDQEGKPLGPYGRDMLQAVSFDEKNLHPILKECKFQIACDVTNPLWGDQGASAVYGPQKGADPKIIEEMDRGLQRFSTLTQEVFGKETAQIPGAGAAGGLGFAFLTFLNGTLSSGAELVLEAASLEEALKDADFAVTGEGRLDAQTAMGKAPMAVAALAKKYGVTTLAFAGAALDDAKICNEKGIDAYFPILQEPVSMEEAMEKERAEENLRTTVTQVFRLIHTLWDKQK